MTKTTRATRSRNLFVTLVFVSLVLTLVTVVLSAYIRLAESGLGCTPWPACYGVVGGEPEMRGIAVLRSGGENVAHRGARLAHRYIASLLGLFVIAIAAASFRGRQRGRPGPAIPLLLLGLTLFLSGLGFATPDRTAPLVTVGNLAGGLSMLGLLWWLGQRSVAPPEPPPPAGGGLAPLARIALVLLCLQLILGAWVSANFAAPACPRLVSCDQTWLSPERFRDGFDPRRRLAVEEGRISWRGAGAAIAMAHRAGALVTVGYLVWLGVRVRRRGGRRLRTTATAIMALALLQLLLGLTAVLTALPLLLVTAHNLAAALLLLGVVNLVHCLHPHPPP